jgi:hypothetical protein
MYDKENAAAAAKNVQNTSKAENIKGNQAREGDGN